jgi:apolipoprotein N-acyltransferase
VHQSAFAYDGKWSYADKTRLVIFGEYVPFREYLPFLDSFRLPGGDLTPGDRVKALSVVGPILCFEALFPDVALQQQVNGARLLAVMSIDDWYMGTNAPEQLRAASIWRAVECGLPLVRSAGLGFTLACNSRGRVIAEAPLGEQVPLRVELRVPVEGDGFPGRGWVPWTGVLASIVTIAWPWSAKGRRPGA